MRLAVDFEPIAGVEIIVGPLGPAPARPARALLGLLAFELVSDQTLEVRAPIAHETAEGWPFVVQEGCVRDAHGRILEERLAVRFDCLGHVALVLARGVLDGQRDMILTALRRGRPDWSGGIRAIADLYEGFDERTDSHGR